MRPLEQSPSNAVDLHQSNRTVVKALLNLCGPSAIIWGIPFVVVNAIKRMTQRRARPHVCEEKFEGVPSLADFYASTTVIVVCMMVRIVAAAAHRRPRAVLRSSCKAMPKCSLPCLLGEKTAAGCRLSLPKLTSKQHLLSAAGALAVPFDAALIFNWMPPEYRKGAVGYA